MGNSWWFKGKNHFYKISMRIKRSWEIPWGYPRASDHQWWMEPSLVWRVISWMMLEYLKPILHVLQHIPIFVTDHFDPIAGIATSQPVAISAQVALGLYFYFLQFWVHQSSTDWQCDWLKTVSLCDTPSIHFEFLFFRMFKGHISRKSLCLKVLTAASCRFSA